jgi:hypothetical protein
MYDSSPKSSSMPRNFLVVLLIAVSLVYAVQIATPMRLNTDAIVYLSLATSAVDGTGFNYHGAPERYPLGYPVLIYLIVKMGLGYSCAFTALNCLLLGLGVFASYQVLQLLLHRSKNEALLICCLSLLSFVVVKHVTELASDVVYFGISLCCLWTLAWAGNSAGTSQRIYRTALGGGLVLLAIFIRTIGIALVPAFLLVAVGGVSQVRTWIPRLLAKRLAVVSFALAFIILAVISFWFVAHTRYFQIATQTYRDRGIFQSIEKAAQFQINEFGELFLNLPKAKLPNSLRSGVAIAGLLSIILLALGFTGKIDKTWVVEIYLFFYLFILCGAPWQDTRYLLPITPLLLGYACIFVKKRSHQSMKFASAAYVIYFCLLGIAALAYSTRISLAGNSFPDVYGDGLLRSTYKTAFRGAAAGESGEINQDALALLYRYEPRSGRDTPK